MELEGGITPDRDGPPRLYAWGWNDDGQCGVGGYKDCLSPTMVSSGEGETLVDVACGKLISAAITREGSVYTWGLWNGKPLYLPERLLHWNTGSSQLCEVACGLETVLVLTTRGEMLIWGELAAGLPQMETPHQNVERPQNMRKGLALAGLGGPIARRSLHSLPCAMVDGSQMEGRVIRHVACGASHAVCVSESGEVFVWGSNEFGQLGLGRPDIDRVMVPMRVAPETLLGERIISAACGTQHTLLLTDSGSVLACGGNLHGQLGVSRSSCLEPGFVRITLGAAAGRKFVGVACGAFFSVLTSDQGELIVHGENNVGQLGLSMPVATHIGTCLRVAVATPVKIPQLPAESEPIRFVVGGGTQCLCATDSGVLIWGRNVEGFLGLGHKNDQTSPAMIPLATFNARRILRLASGFAHNLALVQ